MAPSRATCVINGIPQDKNGKHVGPCESKPNKWFGQSKKRWYLKDGSVLDHFVDENIYRRLFFAGENNSVVVPIDYPIADKHFDSLSEAEKESKIIEITKNIFNK